MTKQGVLNEEIILSYLDLKTLFATIYLEIIMIKKRSDICKYAKHSPGIFITSSQN